MTLACFRTASTTQHILKVVCLSVPWTVILIVHQDCGAITQLYPFGTTTQVSSTREFSRFEGMNISTAFSPQIYAERNPEIRRSSMPSLSSQLVAVPPPSPPSSATTGDEASSPPQSAVVSGIMKANSRLIIPTRVSTTPNGDTSCDEFSTTRSDVTRDEFLSPPTDVHFAEFYSIPSPACLTPIPYVQRGFGFRDKRPRRRGTRTKP